jgi:predicted Zn-dependent protease
MAATARMPHGKHFTQRESWDELRRNVREAVTAFFFDRPLPASIRLHLVRLRRPEQALLHPRKAITLNPRDDVSYYRLSQAYKALGNTSEQQKSLAEFERLRGQSANQQQTKLSRPREVTKQEIDATAPQ